MQNHENQEQNGDNSEKLVIAVLKRKPAMLNLRSVIRALSEHESDAFLDVLKKYGGSRYIMLYGVYRFEPSGGEPLRDSNIMEHLAMSKVSFNTTKSRLNEKLQHFLADRFTGETSTMPQKLADIPRLLYASRAHPLISISILLSLEKRLRDLDLPDGLAKVYDALRRLYVHSGKYYQYTRAYHRSISYALGIEKADGLLMEFSRKVGEYSLSKNEEIIPVITRIKEEIASLAGMYTSHRLRACCDIANITFALYVPAKEAIRNDEPVEDMLARLRATFRAWPDDARYASMSVLADLLSLEYYHGMGLENKAKQYYEAVNDNLSVLLRCQSLCYASHFLISKLEICKARGTLIGIAEENRVLLRNFRPLFLDHVSYTNFMIYIAVSWFYNRRYKRMMNTLNELQRRVVFCDMPHAETEVQILMAIGQIKSFQYDDAREQLKSLALKARRGNVGNILALVSYLRAVIKRNLKSNHRNPKLSVNKLRLHFCRINTGEKKVLGYMDWDNTNLLRHTALRLEEAMSKE